MDLGVCYYPEHWPEETWAPDARRMKDLGLTWVRIGEFAWSRLEPAPGDLHFDWLDRAVDTLGEAGLKVVLGTPTATPPKWLVDTYDDVLQVGADGHVRKFGSRRHYCFNSASYREETTRIVTLLGKRYGSHEAVQAWQTDNEYGCHDTVRCYCENCVKAFRDWLEAKYEDVNILNEAWWNVFWSMEYRSFAEIDLPNRTVTEPNPSHGLDFYRFSSDSVVAYNRVQCELIRQRSKAPITHNAMIFFGDYDVFKLAEDLDILTWDSYPLGMLEQSSLAPEVKENFLRVGHPDLISLMHDLYYGTKNKPFWVMEQQPGQVNWAPSNPLPAPSAVRLWTHQAFAHGADVVAYFRWRAAVGAQETMHAGLNHHDGTPDRATEEVRRVCSELETPQPPFPGGPVERSADRGGPPHASVALLFDYENLWATNLQPHAAGWNYWTLMADWYSALRGLGVDVAVTHPRRDLSAYKVVFAPALYLVDDALAEHLEAYVAGGGHLVVGPRSGAKTMSNLAQAPAPGPLSELMGVNIRHMDALRPGITEHVEFGGERHAYAVWADLLTPTTAEVLAVYETPAYAGTAAVTRQVSGAGHCVTLGMWGTVETNQKLFEGLLETAGIATIELPEGVRRTVRGPHNYTFNFTPDKVMLGGSGLEPYGVRINRGERAGHEPEKY